MTGVWRTPDSPGMFTPPSDIPTAGLVCARRRRNRQGARACTLAAPVDRRSRRHACSRRLAPGRTDRRRRCATIICNMRSHGSCWPRASSSSISPIIARRDDWARAVGLRPMHYLSTRGATAPHGFADVLLGGLAPDGGLFMPERWPRFRRTRSRLSPAPIMRDVAFRDPEPLRRRRHSPPTNCKAILRRLCGLRCGRCRAAGRDRTRPSCWSSSTAPRSPSRTWRCSCWAGCSPARWARGGARDGVGGDVGRYRLGGDRGAWRPRQHRGLRPASAGRVSEVQRRQMTTAPFAQCPQHRPRRQLRRLPGDREIPVCRCALCREVGLAAVNSINFVRIAAQSVYYFTAAARARRARPSFVVPTGNFGDVFAGEAAMRMGLAVERLIVATNANDIMARALDDGVYAAGQASADLSPSMDIQVASNFERALFEASGRDAAGSARRWRRSGANGASRSAAHPRPRCGPAMRPQRSATRRRWRPSGAVTAETGRLIDPHTAVGLARGTKKARVAGGGPVVVLSTAHPAKFPDAV